MLRGLYFNVWFRDMWNYHPSMPIRNLHMIEDMVEIGANTLLWSCLGSGSICLPYLDREANDPTAPRLRLYGFMNDSEFVRECAKRGITAYAILWKAQMWEFPAEFNEDESELLSLNIMRGASENKKWVGMSELSTNKYPKIFEPIEKYFPGGLYNYKGEKVGDFLQEFKSVSLEGRNIFSAWVMAPGHEHKCYAPCSVKTSYKAYMKRDIEMMIDAGARGLEIDEYDTQKHVLQNAGCFCDECVDSFRDYLLSHNIALPSDAGDISEFNYRQYLLQKGYRDSDLLAANGSERWKVPLYREFAAMQMESIETVVRELSTHAKTYSRKTTGDEIKVTANIFQCFPYSWDCKKYLDILAGEKTKIALRQDGWYQYAFGWLNGKESCFVEDPNPYVRDMLHDIQNGINDRFILFTVEPMAHGVHVSFPYGSWLQNQEKDAFWPDLRLCKKLGAWLDERKHLFPKNPVADVGVVYDVLSAYENLMFEPDHDKSVKLDLAPDTPLGGVGVFDSDGSFPVFFEFIQKLSDRQNLYNVLFESPDEPLTNERLAPYKKIIVPDAFLMNEETADALKAYTQSGGEVITLSRAVKGLASFKNYARDDADLLIRENLQDKGIVSTVNHDKAGIALHKTSTGYALHVVNYNFNESTHRIDPVNVSFDLGLPCEKAVLHSFPENEAVKCEIKNNRLELRNAGIYTIIEF